MKTVLAFLKAIFWAPLVWTASRAKALVQKVWPSNATAGTNAKPFWQKLKDLGSAIRDVWTDIEGWTWIKRLAAVIVLGAGLTGAFIVGHRIGHRKVPGLQRQAVAQAKTITGQIKTIGALQSDLAAAKADLSRALERKAADAPPVKARVKNGKSAKVSVQTKKPSAGSGFSMSGFFN